MSRLRLNKVANPSNPPTNTLELFYASVTSKPSVIDQSGNIVVLGGFSIKDYRLVKVTNVFQGTVLYTPSVGTLAGYVECWGAGGGSAGLAAATAAQIAIGQAGGGGGYSAAFITGAGWKTSFTVQVGLGGPGGAASASNGTAGTDTTFDSPSVVTAKGGAAGLTANTLASGTTNTLGPQGALGGASASGVGDIKFDGGQQAAPGLRISGSIGHSTPGPASGMGGDGGTAISIVVAGGGAGGAAVNYGGGGGGALDGNATARAGGAGGNGLMRIWEFA